MEGKMKYSKLLLLWFITLVLIGCSDQQTSTEQSATKSPVTPNIQTPAALPTLAFFQNPTSPVMPTETLLSMPKVTPNPPFILDRLRMVVVRNGNLYRQNGTNPLVQLTYSGKDRDPIISDDGEKIAFYRGEAFDNVYSINADGSKEQAIIRNQSLPVLGRGDVEALTFVPNTHFLFFNTYLCNASKALYNAPDCTVGIYSVDIDSGEISELVSGLSGNGTQTRNFEVSPDGKYISVAASGHIDIYSLYMQWIDISKQDVIPYNRTIPDEFLLLQYWLPDSSGLIAILPSDIYNEPATPPHTFTAWRYTIANKVDNGAAVQILIDPPIVFNSACNFSVSPDRNWIFYISDRIPSLYLGNMNDAHSQAYNWENGCPSLLVASPQWSPDSQHFAWQGTIVAVDGTSISIDGDFIGWIDAKYYFYSAIENNGVKIHIGEINGKSIALPENFQWSPTYIILSQ